MEDDFLYKAQKEVDDLEEQLKSLRTAIKVYMEMMPDRTRIISEPVRTPPSSRVKSKAGRKKTERTQEIVRVCREHIEQQGPEKTKNLVGLLSLKGLAIVAHRPDGMLRSMLLKDGGFLFDKATGRWGLKRSLVNEKLYGEQIDAEQKHDV